MVAAMNTQTQTLQSLKKMPRPSGLRMSVA